MHWPLSLSLEHKDGDFIQAVCDKEVRLELPGEPGRIPKVDIFHDGKLITTITDIIETH